jgi:hypothetical protein
MTKTPGNEGWNFFLIGCCKERDESLKGVV